MLVGVGWEGFSLKAHSPLVKFSSAWSWACQKKTVACTLLRPVFWQKSPLPKETWEGKIAGDQCGGFYHIV